VWSETVSWCNSRDEYHDPYHAKLANLAGKLERERDEARREAEAWRAFARLNVAGNVAEKKKFPWENDQEVAGEALPPSPCSASSESPTNSEKMERICKCGCGRRLSAMDCDCPELTDSQKALKGRILADVSANQKARAEGREAARAGMKIDANPYSERHETHWQWLDAWATWNMESQQNATAQTPATGASADTHINLKTT
jgi:hypothetical protein